jgi:hypothetical protein
MLVAGVLLVSLGPASADVSPALSPHFPKPVALTPNVEFWKRIYTEHGVGDFVLHDRENLSAIYAVVRVPETANQIRADQLAKPEVDRVRAKYRELLLRLADGIAPEDLDADGRAVARMWGCPCAPDSLRRAADNIRVQQGLREKVDEGLQRARGLLPRIVPILKRHDVPVELAALPLIESAYNPAAYSKAGAAGLWQFMRSTGKQYALVKGRKDYRRDPLRATEAAARLLRNNYETLGSWPLAITAYNHGHVGIQAASSAVGSKAIEDIVASYRGPRFGFASRNFYAGFLAALDVLHPYLAGHARPHEAKERRRGAQQAAVASRPSRVPAVSRPEPAALPAVPGSPQPAETGAPLAPLAPVEGPQVADDGPGEAERPIDDGAPADDSLPVEHAIAPTDVVVAAEVSPPATEIPPDPVAERGPAPDAPPPDVPAEVSEADTAEAASP